MLLVQKIKKNIAGEDVQTVDPTQEEEDDVFLTKTFPHILINI